MHTHFRWRSCISRPTRLMTWGEMFSNDERSDIFLLFMAGAEHHCLPNHALCDQLPSVGEARQPNQLGRDEQKLGSSLISRWLARRLSFLPSLAPTR